MPQVELLKPHTHAGVDHAPGAVIELDHDLGRWLADLGIARPVRLYRNDTGALVAETQSSVDGSYAFHGCRWTSGTS